MPNISHTSNRQLEGVREDVILHLRYITYIKERKKAKRMT